MTGAPPDIQSPEFEQLLEWETAEDERHDAVTDDGWVLQLHRYRSQGAPRSTPVVMGHGLAGSRFIYDCDDDASLARYLAGRGHDVWLVDLRGRNDSWPETGPDPALQWTFDDLVAFDVPAAVQKACEVSEAADALWVGQEMSGIALYAAALAGTAAPLRGGVTLGSPAVTPPDAQVPGVTMPFPQPDGTRMPFSAVRDIGPRLAVEQSEFLESSFRPANTDWLVTARYFRHGVPDEATALCDQFRDWMVEGVMRTRDGSVVYSDRLGDVRIPVLMMVGAADLQRPPAAVRATFEALGSSDKTFVRAGTEDGFSVDFGHDDLLCGRASPAEVFPVIADWLEAHGEQA